MAYGEPSGHEPRAMQRGLLLLEAVAAIGPGASAREIAQHSGIPRATAYKLLNLLVADGYLVRIADLSGFALGARIQQLAGPQPGPAESHNSTVLADIRGSVRFGVVLASFVDDRVRLVDLDPDHELPGADAMCSHPHASAVGKIMLANRPRPEADPAAARALPALTAATIVEPPALHRQLAAVRENGVAVEIDESRAGRSALAVPVTDAQCRVTGALTMIGRTGRIPVSEPSLVTLLKRHASRLRLPAGSLSA